MKVQKTKVLRGIFGPERDEATGDCRKLHNAEPQDLYAAPSIIPVTKSRKIR